MVQAYIDRIKQVNPVINALVSDCFEQALTEARQVDAKIDQILNGKSHVEHQDILDLPLLGIPISIKESIAVKGQPCTAGLYIKKGILMEQDAVVVDLMRKSGAIIIGEWFEFGSVFL